MADKTTTRKGSMIVYEDWLDAVDSLPSNEDKWEAIAAILRYGLKGEISGLNAIGQFALAMAKGQIDTNLARRESGRKGGAPKNNLNASKNNQKQPKTTKNNQKQPNNVNDNDNVNKEKENKEKVIQKENKEKKIIKEIKENIIEDNVKEKEKNTLFTEPTIETFSGEERKIAPKERRFVKPTIAEIAAYCRERNNGVEATAFYDFYESKGWKVGNQPMKNWQAAVRTWERQDGRRATSKPQSTTRVELPTDYSKLIPGNHV